MSRTVTLASIQQCILFKVITLVFKCIHGQAPSYLQKLIVLKQPRREGMRSDKQTIILETPHTTKKTHAARYYCRGTRTME